MQPYTGYYVLFNILILIYFIALKRRLSHLEAYFKETAKTVEKELLFDDIHPLTVPKDLQEVEPLIQEINKLVIYLNRKSQVAQSFNANIAHELRAPLAELKAKMEYSLYFASVPQRCTAEMSDFIQKIDNLEEIVSQMLYVSNNNINNLNTSMQRVLLNDIITETIDTKQKEISYKRLKVETEINQAISIHGHKKLLRYAVGNIIDNAVKYSRPDGTITIRLEKRRNFISLIVADNGVGIDKRELKLIFHPYYRGENSSSYSDGYGLGLSLATWIFELHSAAIRIRSIKDRGTCVVVKFHTS